MAIAASALTPIGTLAADARDEMISTVIKGYLQPGSVDSGDPTKCLENCSTIDAKYQALVKEVQ
jgi:hypothetical protein